MVKPSTSPWPRRLLHSAGVVLMFGAQVFAAGVIVLGKPFTTEVAMLLRNLAFIACAFGPVLTYGWFLAKAADRQTAPLDVRTLLLRYLTFGLLIAVPYGLAELAFPGPWLSDGD
jgi:positive regulator of sigma E activity